MNKPQDIQKAHDVKYPANVESNCCGAAVLGADENNHGICAACKEHCVGEEIEEAN